MPLVAKLTFDSIEIVARPRVARMTAPVELTTTQVARARI